MKRVLTVWVLAAILLIPQASSSAALETGMLALAEDAGMVKSAIEYRNEIWVHSENYLYRMDTQTGELETLPEGMQAATDYDYLLTQSDQLWGLNIEQGTLSPLFVEDEALTSGEPVTLGLAKLLEEAADAGGEFHLPSQALAHEGRLYLLFPNVAMDLYNIALLSFDMKSGAGRRHQADTVQLMCEYKDGDLLALSFDEAAYMNRSALTWPQMELMAFDAERDRLVKLITVGLEVNTGIRVRSMAYDPQDGSIYLAARNKLYSVAYTGETQQCAYLKEGGYEAAVSGAMLLLPDQQVLVSNALQVQVVSTNPALMPKSKVRIYADSMGMLDHDNASYSSVPVEHSEMVPYHNVLQLSELWLAGEDKTEIFSLSTEAIDIKVLKEKEYYYDLSGSEALRQYVDSLPPQIAELAMHEGKLVMIPYYRVTMGAVYRPDLFEELGLEVPRSFYQVCDLIDKWNDELADEYPGYAPTQTNDMLQSLSFLAINTYGAHCAAGREEFDLMSPTLRQMLERAASVRYENIGYVDHDGSGRQVLMNGLHGGYALYPWMLTDNPGKKWNQNTPLILSVNEGEEPLVSSQVLLLMVSPYAEFPEEALSYLENYVQGIKGEQLLTINPLVAEPVIDQVFVEETWPAMQENLELMQKTVDEAEGAEKREAQRLLDEAQAQADEDWNTRRFTISEEMIAAYQAFIENSFIKQADDPVSFFEFGGSGLDPLLQYVWGNTSLDQFLTETDQRLRLKSLENQ